MFLSYVHTFRAIAILFVVAGHAIWILQWPADAPTRDILADTLENGTVLFLFVAGFLFQHLSKRYAYRDYLSKKFKNVTLPYLILSTPSALEGAFAQHVYRQYPQLVGTSAVYRYLWFMIKGGAGNNKALWFVPMLVSAWRVRWRSSCGRWA